jgi:hypothetical protein
MRAFGPDAPFGSIYVGKHVYLALVRRVSFFCCICPLLVRPFAPYRHAMLVRLHLGLAFAQTLVNLRG